MSTGGKKILWVFAFLVVTFTGDRIGGALLESIVSQSQFRFSRLYRGEAGCDLLFMGNSRGLIFYQPYIEEKTGLQTCNLSYNAMPMSLATVLLEDYLDNNKAPRKLILDISMLDTRMDENLSTGFNCYTPYSPRLRNFLKARFPKAYYGGRVSHLYRYNNEVFQRALFYWKKSDKDWLLDRVITPTLQEKVKEEGPFLFTFTGEMLADLKAVVDTYQEKGVEVALVVNPYYPPFAKKIANLDELIAAIEKATGLTVHNYADSIAGTEGFGDYQHLNKTGSRQYLDLLIKDGILPVSDSFGFSEGGEH
ncbi:MAG: hypothetical protein Kow0027_28520 [Saprospiraceae bacterium]